MKILVTGAKGFVGKNLCAQLKNIRDGKARNYGIAGQAGNDGKGQAGNDGGRQAGNDGSLVGNDGSLVGNDGSLVGNDGVRHARPDRASLSIDEVFEYDLDSTPEELDAWCAQADFVFNLAGVNRPQNASEFMEGNFGFASVLLDTLRKHGNACPVMLSSSQQASLTGRFGNSEYGRSKKAGEDLFLRYGEEIAGQAGNDGKGQAGNDGKGQACNDGKGQAGNDGKGQAGNDDGRHARPDRASQKGLQPRVLVYRFPNLFGKWCRPNYNSAVATFCNAVANDLPYTVNDPSVELELLYIDDLVDEMIACLRGEEHRCEFEGLEVIPKRFPVKPGMTDAELADAGRYCYVPTTHKATLGEIVALLKSFEAQRSTLIVPEIPAGSFAKKLYSTFLSYLPASKVAFPLKTNSDARGSFTELVKTLSCGQFSVNVSLPGVTKGQHWHNTKWEFFIVVSGRALIQERRIGSDEVLNFEVSGSEIKAVHMLPGYTHNIVNLSDTEPLVTLMWANELFDPERPDTYFEPVE